MTTATQVTTGVVVGTLGLLAIAIVLLTTTGNGSWDNTRRSASTSPPPEVFTGNESSLADLDLVRGEGGSLYLYLDTPAIIPTGHYPQGSD